MNKTEVPALEEPMSGGTQTLSKADQLEEEN